MDGRKCAQQWQQSILQDSQTFFHQEGFPPCLAIIQVGEHPASTVYVQHKQKVAHGLGIRTVCHSLPRSIEFQALQDLLSQLNQDPSVHGILLQLPLPERLEARVLLNSIDPSKDVDGLHEVNIGRLWAGEGKGFVPCTPKGCLRLIQTYHPTLEGRKAVVVGRSLLVGKPMTALLLQQNVTVTLAHSKTTDLAHLCREADLLVVAVGVPDLIQKEFLKPGGMVVDVGITQSGKEGSLKGDVNFQEACEVSGWVTPVPGGVGPMTIAALMDNTLLAARRSL